VIPVAESAMSGFLVWGIRPQVFSFSPLPRWYSLLFAVGIVGGYAIMRGMFKREGKPLALLDWLLVYVVVGMLAGMRLGHVIFYQPDYYLRPGHLWEIPQIWKGGYASHGAFAGVIVALLLFARKHKETPFLWLCDRVAIISTFTAGCIRLGNFANSEMIGRPSNVPWAIVFAQVDRLPRHPAQLYEAIGYFVVCRLSYLWYRKSDWHLSPGRLVGFIMAVAFFWRFICEFFKEDQVVFEHGMVLNMGQVLSLPFIVVGLAMALGVARRRGQDLRAATGTPT
jgi:prolipoprotein diacylglyceryl transferase